MASFTQADLDAVNIALKTSTVARIRFEGREVEYRSLADLERLKAIIERDLGTNRPRFSLAGFTKQSS